MNANGAFSGRRLTVKCVAEVQSAIRRELQPADWRDIQCDQTYWREIGINPEYEDPISVRLQQAVENYMSPWIEAIYRTGDVDVVTQILPNISLSALNKITGVRVSEIREFINENGLYVNVLNTDYVLVGEITDVYINPKRGIKAATYESKKPGGGVVIKAGTNWNEVQGKMEGMRKEKEVVSFKIQEKSKVSGRDKAPKTSVTPEQIRLARLAESNYQRFCKMGPFYGKGVGPTFRVSAEPLSLPYEYYERFKQIGASLVEYTKNKGIPIPISFRIDTIMDDDGIIWVNEVQSDDGAEDLIIAKQVIYNNIELSQTLPFYFIWAVCERLGVNMEDVLNGRKNYVY